MVAEFRKNLISEVATILSISRAIAITVHPRTDSHQMHLIQERDLRRLNNLVITYRGGKCYQITFPVQCWFFTRHQSTQTQRKDITLWPWMTGSMLPHQMCHIAVLSNKRSSLCGEETAHNYGFSQGVFQTGSDTILIWTDINETGISFDTCYIHRSISVRLCSSYFLVVVVCSSKTIQILHRLGVALN